jgi:hypothetical protein
MPSTFAAARLADESVQLIVSLSAPLERFPAEWNHSVEKKSTQIQKLEHILIAQIDST